VDGVITPEAVSILILVVTYAFLFTDRFHGLHRTPLAMAGAVAMIIAGKLLGFYPTFPEEGAGGHDVITALGAVDWNTLGLLFGMMIIVGIFEETGIFEHIAIRLAKITGGSYWRLMVALGWFTFVASALLDNVTSVIFVSSITVSIASILGVNPIPLLISEAIMSGVGGMATLIGDPPNVIIGSAAGFSFVDFLIYLTPIALIVGLVTTGIFRLLFRESVAFQHENPESLKELKADEALKDRRMLKRMSVVFGLVILLFFIHGIVHMEASEVAITGASLALVWARPTLSDILARVKWDVLLFFGGLFVIVGGLEAAGVLGEIAQWLGTIIQQQPVLALLVVLWGSAFLSAIVDNIPFTIAFAPILVTLQGTGVDVFPFWWTLAAGVALGGVATPIGASANVYVVSLAEHSGYPISFARWMRAGVPAAVIQLLIASVIIYGMNQLGIF